MITIGKHELRYLNDTLSAADDGEKTVLIRPKSQQQPSYPNSVMPNEIEYEPATKSDSLQTAKLQILNGSGAGKELPLLKPSIKLGKAGAELVQINRSQTVTSSFVWTVLPTMRPQSQRRGHWRRRPQAGKIMM